MGITVTFANNAGRSTDIVSSTDTIRKALEEHGIDYSRGMVMLDGAQLRAGDLDKTFEEYGIADHCYLACIVKMDNA